MIQKIFEMNKQTTRTELEVTIEREVLPSHIAQSQIAKHQSVHRNLVSAINTRIPSGPDNFISL